MPDFLKGLLIFLLVEYGLFYLQAQENEHYFNIKFELRITIIKLEIMSEYNIASRADLRNDLNNYDKSEQSKRKRRTRNDQEGRTFTCTCGKSYLSYPALYTHIKTKHNGKAEFGKMEKRDEQHFAADSPEIKEQDDIESVEKQEDHNNIQQLRAFLSIYFPIANKDKEEIKKTKENLKEQLIFIKLVKEYWEKHRKEEEVFQNDVYLTSIDYVLGKFYLEIETDISKSCLKYMADFVINLRNGINELKEDNQFCKHQNANHLPLMLNDVFIQKFQNNQEGHIYRKYPTIICRTLYYFGKWLFQERFTNFLIKFNHV